MPPSLRVNTNVASRGMVTPSKGGWEIRLAWISSYEVLHVTNIVRRSGVRAMPVISSPTTPLSKRRTSPVCVSRISIWLFKP